MLAILSTTFLALLTPEEAVGYVDKLPANDLKALQNEVNPKEIVIVSNELSQVQEEDIDVQDIPSQFLDWLSGVEILPKKKSSDALNILITETVSDVSDILSAMSLKSLSDNVWFVISKNRKPEEMFSFAKKQNKRQKWLNPQAQLYFLQTCFNDGANPCYKLVTDVIGNAKEDPIFKVTAESCFDFPFNKLAFIHYRLVEYLELAAIFHKLL